MIRVLKPEWLEYFKAHGNNDSRNSTLKNRQDKFKKVLKLLTIHLQIMGT